MSSWTFEWLLSRNATIAIVIVLFVVVGACYLLQWYRRILLLGQSSQLKWRFLKLFCLRGSSLAILLWMLLGLSFRASEKTLAPIYICVDRSASMLERDEQNSNGSSISRFEQATKAASGLKSQIESSLSKNGSKASVELFFVGEQLVPTDLAVVQQLASTGDKAKEQPGQNDSGSRLQFDEASRLGINLLDLLGRTNLKSPSMVYLLSDGHVTDSLADETMVNQVSRIARARNTKIISLVAGRADDGASIAITDVQIPETIFLADRVQISAQIRARSLNGETLEARLLDADQAASFQEVKPTSDDFVTPVVFACDAAQAGMNHRTIAVNASTGSTGRVSGHEKRIDADQATVDVSYFVRTNPISVLLVADRYSYETRYVKNLLERQKQKNTGGGKYFDVTSCIADASPKLVQSDESMITYLPTASEWWEKFEVCVLIDPDLSRLDQLQSLAIKDAVSDHGCGLVYVAGLNNKLRGLRNRMWADLLPIRAVENESLELNSDLKASTAITPIGVGLGMGEVNRYLLAKQAQFSVPKIESFFRVNANPNAFVLARFLPVRSNKPPEDALDESESWPMTSMHFVGNGRVLFQATDETYRWRGFKSSEDLFNKYWMDLLDIAIKRSSQTNKNRILKIELTNDQIYQGRDLIFEVKSLGASNDLLDEMSFILRGKDGADLPATWTKLSGNSNPEAAKFRLSTAGLPSGEYSLNVGNDIDTPMASRASFAIITTPEERAAVKPDFEHMNKLAVQSGGQSFRLSQWRELKVDLSNAEAIHIERLPPSSFWNHPLVVLLLVTLLSAEWYFRNRWGLV